MNRSEANYVMQVGGVPLAAKPDLESLLRCRWLPNFRLTPSAAARAAAEIAAALEHLHSRHICHGDVYAHNVLADANGTVVLLDYGALSTSEEMLS